MQFYNITGLNYTIWNEHLREVHYQTESKNKSREINERVENETHWNLYTEYESRDDVGITFDNPRKPNSVMLSSQLGHGERLMNLWVSSIKIFKLWLHADSVQVIMFFIPIIHVNGSCIVQRILIVGVFV